ncbi:MAG TPA: hypothetical protein VII64_07205 [Thermodesulfobacteriota bacterium]
MVVGVSVSDSVSVLVSVSVPNSESRLPVLSRLSSPKGLSRLSRVSVSSPSVPLSDPPLIIVSLSGRVVVPGIVPVVPGGSVVVGGGNCAADDGRSVVGKGISVVGELRPVIGGIVPVVAGGVGVTGDGVRVVAGGEGVAGDTPPPVAPVWANEAGAANIVMSAAVMKAVFLMIVLLCRLLKKAHICLSSRSSVRRTKRVRLLPRSPI